MRLTALFWWIDRWRKSSAYMDMTLEEQGAYRNLLDEAHLRGGPLPNDERILAKACGDATAWIRVRTTVLARFYLQADGWHNVTLDEVFARTMELSRDRSRAGHIGGLRSAASKRQAKLQALPKANGEAKAQANGKSPSPSPSPSPDTVSGPGIRTVKSNGSEQLSKGSDSSVAGEPSHRILSKQMAAKILTDENVRRHARRIR